MSRNDPISTCRSSILPSSSLKIHSLLPCPYQNRCLIWLNNLIAYLLLLLKIALLLIFCTALAWKKKSVSCSVLSDSVTPWTVACQAPLSILQARLLEWVAVPFSRGSFQPRDQIQISCIAGEFLTIWVTREAHRLKIKYTISNLHV